METSHLSPQAKAILDQGEDVIKLWNRRPHFVFTELTERLLQKVQWIYEQTTLMQSLPEYELYDIESMSIVGKTGAGKSTFCRYFQKLYPRTSTPDQELIPVLHVKLKSQIAGLSGFYTALLEPYGSPIANFRVTTAQRMNLSEMHNMVKNYIKKAETKIIFVDEFQHIYEDRKKGSVINQTIINHLKLLMEEARVAIIPVGVLNVEEFLNLDSQLVGRCPIYDYSRFEYWRFPDREEGIDPETIARDIRKSYPKISKPTLRIKTIEMIRALQTKNEQQRDQFRNLLKSFEANLVFPRPSNLSSTQNASAIFRQVKFSSIEEGELDQTNMRKVAWLIEKASQLAVDREHDHIWLSDIQDVNK